MQNAECRSPEGIRRERDADVRCFAGVGGGGRRGGAGGAAFGDAGDCASAPVAAASRVVVTTPRQMVCGIRSIKHSDPEPLITMQFIMPFFQEKIRANASLKNATKYYMICDFLIGDF